tara:strand:+ start:6505 stop:7293 length:789 start_codon:yes stop_codon:yes gene_type:complete
MKITLLTSNMPRHNYLINLLSKNCDKLYVLQESRTIFPGIRESNYKVSSIMSNYFKKVNFYENKIFKNPILNFKNQNISLYPLIMGDINFIDINKINNFLKSDLFIVFGTSFLKNKIVEILIRKKAINIHMGLSPFYKGTDCNFWALYDNNPHLVGATIHYLTKGIDDGKIIFHALSEHRTNPFEYSMSTVMAAFKGIEKHINNSTLKTLSPINQNKDLTIKYSTKKDFNDNIIKKFMKKNINLKFKFDKNNFYKNPFILKK